MYLIPALKLCCKLVGIWWYLSIKLLAINRFDHCSAWYGVLVGELRLCYAFFQFYIYPHSYVYYRTALLLLPDSTQHIPISRYLADPSLLVTFPFSPCFPHLCCLSSVESPPMICVCVSQYCTDFLDSSCYWLVTILRIQWLISMITNAFVDSPWLILDD